MISPTLESCLEGIIIENFLQRWNRGRALANAPEGFWSDEIQITTATLRRSFACCGIKELWEAAFQMYGYTQKTFVYAATIFVPAYKNTKNIGAEDRFDEDAYCNS